ncbi:MAG TPA: type II toxin-antitoxin system mRNA interferase toxin, RelE/StbE family [Candidatus Atribacteria bacterium]|nr:type II toxin-antitoxin system mRNA interferase toxin, RelE/StbE family [Candidatus Atribacteria bacterium]
MFKIIFKQSVIKDVKKIPKKDLQRIANDIKILKFNPLPPGTKKIKKSRKNYYRIRQGNFRVGYRVDLSKKLVEIIFIKRRSEKTY